MATPMGPPPPKTSSFAAVAAAAADAATSSTADLSASSSEPPPITTTPTAPPPPQNPNPSNSEEKPQLDSNSAEISPTDENKGENNGELNPNRESKPHHVEVPYTIPLWSHAPSQPFFLEVLKDGSIIDQLDVTKKGAYMFGRVDLCDFVLEHSSISRFHAVLQFKGNGDAFIYDLGSTHGTFINKSQVKKKVYVELHVGDVIRFGLSSRMYIFQGPEELMPPEADLNSIKYAKLREEKQDREASLRRAREEAALADGISWGMSEDAIEEAEDDPDEITWQTYKGELTEKQQKTREKVLKRMEKIAHMKKEIAAIRAKDISQGGLTQGQQTQIARNEMRISQIAEELESLEETLNDSIQESIGARAGKLSRGKNRGAGDDEEDFSSDDDEFYDRTKKKSSIKSVDSQSVETADSLLEKKDTILKEMEEIKKLLLDEKNKISTSVEPDAGDALDAFMSGLSSRLVLDKTVQLEKELSTLQTELDRILYLLQIADPTGEAAKKWQPKSEEPKSKRLEPPRSVAKKTEKHPVVNKKINDVDGKPLTGSPEKLADGDTIEEESKVSEGESSVYTVVKPQWLGAVGEKQREEETRKPESLSDAHEADEFVDYKDRKKILSNAESDLESAAPGLILRKKKEVEKSADDNGEDSNPSVSKSTGSEMNVEDAVALLLKHKRGYHASDEEEDGVGKEERQHKRKRRVLGPEKPAFLESNKDYDDPWMPPEGQSGDGRTSLNERLGY